MIEYYILFWHPEQGGLNQLIEQYGMKGAKIAFMIPHNKRIIVIFEVEKTED